MVPHNCHRQIWIVHNENWIYLLSFSQACHHLPIAYKGTPCPNSNPRKVISVLESTISWYYRQPKWAHLTIVLWSSELMPVPPKMSTNTMPVFDPSIQVFLCLPCKARPPCRPDCRYTGVVRITGLVYCPALLCKARWNGWLVLSHISLLSCSPLLKFKRLPLCSLSFVLIRLDLDI